MKNSHFTALACPLDYSPLISNGKTARCDRGHNFDHDRRGTLNLLPVQFKKSLHPGDSQEMVIARRDFLARGCYAPIAEKLNMLVARYAMATQKDVTILDAGCGEGYYTHGLARSLATLDYEAGFSIAGLDISKDAIQLAARQYEGVAWLVGTNARLPIQAAGVDCVLSLFGFPVWEEFRRVLKRSGIVITCDAGENHLIELRRILYPEVALKEARQANVTGFTEIESHRVTAKFTLPAGEATAQLIGMTPHAFRARRGNVASAVEAGFPTLTLDVVFRIHHC